MLSASFRWFLGMAYLGPFGMLSVASCGSGDSNLLIDVTNVPSRSVKLVVKATLDGKDATSTREVTAPTEQFGVVLPSSVAGHLTLTIQSLDIDGCIQGAGQVEAELPAGRNDLSVALTAKSPRQCGVLLPCAKDTLCTPTPKPATGSSTVWGLWQVAPNDVWAVGDGGLAVHFDGTSWTTSQTPAGTGYLNAVWASGASDVWAVGTTGTILHYDGKQWSSSFNNAMYDLNGVFGLDSRTVWAVGSTSTATPGPGEFHKWDGTSWKPVSTGITGKLYGVWASAANDLYATGVGGLILHFNGATWSSSTPTTNDLRFIWGTGPNLFFAVGNNATLLRNTGSGWNKPAVVDYGATLFAVSGDANTIYSVGNSGVNGNTIKGAAPFDSFAVQRTGSNADLSALTIGKDGIGWVGGKNGFIAYFDTRP